MEQPKSKSDRSPFLRIKQPWYFLMNANDATHVDLKRYYWKQNSTCDGPLQPNNEGYQTSEIEVQMQHL